jgi:hypothetical protein
MALSLLTLGRSLTFRPLVAMCAVTMALSACVPSHNWREIVVEHGGVAVMFPSKPDRLSRPIDLNGITLTMTMVGSKIDRSAYTVAWVDLPSAALAQQALENMRIGMLKNVGYSDPVSTLNAGNGVRTQAVKVRLRGTQVEHPATLLETSMAGTGSQNAAAPPLGRPVMRALFAAKGLRAWQVVAVGPALDSELAKLFTDSFQLVAD